MENISRKERQGHKYIPGHNTVEKQHDSIHDENDKSGPVNGGTQTDNGEGQILRMTDKVIQTACHRSLTQKLGPVYLHKSHQKQHQAKKNQRPADKIEYGYHREVFQTSPGIHLQNIPGSPLQAGSIQ